MERSALLARNDAQQQPAPPAPAADPRRQPRPDWYGIGVLTLLLSSLAAGLEMLAHLAG